MASQLFNSSSADEQSIVHTTATVSVLMVNYNGKRFLDGCLGSIRGRVTCPYEVILVDNGSTDGSAEYVEQNYPWVKLVRAECNLGFAKGTNLAAEYATGDYFFLLNGDTILMTDIAPALRLLQGDRTIGIVGGQAHRASGEERICTGWFPSLTRMWRVGNLWMRPTIRYTAPDLHAFKVEWIEGAWLMTTADNWRALGGLDDYYFLCVDDMDFCRATLNRGLVTVQCKDIHYVHFGGHTESRLRYLYAGFRHYHRKFSGLTARFAADFMLRIGLWARMLVFGCWYAIGRGQRAGDKWRSCLEANRAWSQMRP